MSQETFDWVVDADVHYLGARACHIFRTLSPFHTLGLSAIERYLKALLQADDPTTYSVKVLKSKFVHDIVKLLDEAIPTHPKLNDKTIRRHCETLYNEFEHGRYHVEANRRLLTSEAQIDGIIELGLREMDELICTFRNEVALTDDEKKQTLVNQVHYSRFPEYRKVFQEDNQVIDCFDGMIPLPPRAC